MPEGSGAEQQKTIFHFPSVRPSASLCRRDAVLVLPPGLNQVVLLVAAPGLGLHVSQSGGLHGALGQLRGLFRRGQIQRTDE